jgi:hypothetical protein
MAQKAPIADDRFNFTNYFLGFSGAPGTNGNGSGAALPSNPIGSLQEYCVKCSLPLPIYDLQNTSGQPHQRNFDIIAKVGAIASNGTGTSKKDAKRDAATALLDKLKALGSEVAIAAGSGTNGSGNLSEVDEEMIKQAGNMTKVDVLVSFYLVFFCKFIGTGKSLSEALLLAEHEENMLYTKKFLNVGNNFCTQHVLPRFEVGIFMY